MSEPRVLTPAEVDAFAASLGETITQVRGVYVDEVDVLIATIRAAWAERDEALADARTIYDDMNRIVPAQDAEIERWQKAALAAATTAREMEDSLHASLREARAEIEMLEHEKAWNLEQGDAETQSLRAEIERLKAILEQQRQQSNP